MTVGETYQTPICLLNRYVGLMMKNTLSRAICRAKLRRMNTVKQGSKPDRTTLALAMMILSGTCGTANAAFNDTDFDVSGKIVGAVIADSNTSTIGSNNLSNGLYDPNQPPSGSDDSNVAIDTTLTRFNFGTQTNLPDDEALRSFVSIDFNGTNDNKMNLRLREAYVDWQIGNGSLLVGQTWSTLMDLNRFPDTLLEPTLTGVVFSRQPMVRWSQSFGSFRYDLALESGTNAHITTETEGTALDNSSDIPDFVAAIQTNTDDYWFRASGVVSQIKTKTSDQRTFKDHGWGLQLSGGIKFNEKDQFQVSYFNSRGNDRYVLGIGNTGPMFDANTNEFHLRESQALWTALGHSWMDNLKSTFGYGIWQADAFSWQADTFTETQFALANIKWTARENLTLGVEYNYTFYERSKEQGDDNHRVILAISYDF